MEHCAYLMKMAAVLIAAISICSAVQGQAQAEEPLQMDREAVPGGKVLFWLETSLNRVFLNSDPGSAEAEPVLAPRGGQVSFQACARNSSTRELLGLKCDVVDAVDLQVQVRRVGYVPLTKLSTDTPLSDLDGAEHLPGFVPDPLWNHNVADMGPSENVPFWITVRVPKDVEPGKRMLTLRFSWDQDKQTAELKQAVDVRPLVVQPRKDFPVIHWFRSESLWDHYKTGMWEDERLWEIHRNYMENLWSHGTDVIMVPIFFARRETFQRPAQLLIVDESEPGKYTFDFKHVKRYLDLAKSIGFERFEWSHLWIYWGAENPVRVYTVRDGKHVMLWPPDTDGHGELYHNFLKQFLPRFHEFLTREGVLERSYFHISDEPGEGVHIANYRKGRDFLREHAPWMRGKIMDALSSIEYGRQQLNDIPIPIVSSAPGYIEEGIPHWVYFCCGPRGLYIQRLLDTPLPKIRMSGFLFYRLGAEGFLHWGYNYWHAMEQEKLVDPFQDATGASWPGIPPGDPFTVYPGWDGKPFDSIRWEVFAEALQDYAVLQTAGVKPDDPMLKDIKDYADFPKSEKWIRERVSKLLEMSGQR